MNLAELALRHHAQHRAVWSDGTWSSWGEMRNRAAAVAAGLRELGVREGDRVALIWPTSVDFIVAYLGVLAVGGVAVPLNPSSPPAELERELQMVSAVGALAAGAGADAIGLAATAGTGLRFLVLSGRGSVPSWEDLLAPSPPSFEPAPRRPEDPAVLLFTSGTAGDPKPAVLSHGNLLANIQQVAAVPSGGIQPDDVGFAAIPLFHVFGLNVVLGMALAAGLPLVVEERFSAQRALELFERLGVTLVVGAPPMFQSWVDVEGAPAGAFHSIRRAVSGAAALEPQLAEAFHRRFGVVLDQGYGLTEASPVVTTTVGTGRNLPGSIGRPVPGVELRLVDDAGDDVLQGDPGEIVVRGPNVFSGYWQDPAASAEVLVDGWLHTGDIAVVDDDGDLFMVDRKKDLVIVSGFNVFPEEVERVLCEHPDVLDAVVLGVPDRGTGEAVEAVVVAVPGREPVADQLAAHCRSRLARYKCPTTIRFTGHLPRNLGGKAMRRALRRGEASR